MKVLTSMTFCLLLAALPAQGAGAKEASPAATDTLGLIDRAEQLCKKGPSEEATRDLRRAERALHAGPRSVLNANLYKVVARLLPKADPSRKIWQGALDAAAKELIKTSKTYRRRGWGRVGDQLIADAVHLSPVLAARERRRVSGAGKRGRSKGPKEPKDLLPGFKPSFRYGDWAIEPTVIMNRKLKGKVGEGFATLLGKLKSKDAEVAMDVKRPATRSQAGLVFGAKNEEDYFIYEVLYRGDGGGGRCEAVLYHWKAPQLKRLGEKFFTLTKEQRSDWFRYTVRIEDTTATVFVGGKKLFSGECDRSPYGKAGMYLSGSSQFRGPFYFRKFSMTELAKVRAGEVKSIEASSLSNASETVSPKELLEKINRAEGLIKKERNEDAMLILLNAGPAAHKLKSATLRRTTTETVQKLIELADSNHARYQKVRVAAAHPLVSAAKSYMTEKWYLLARDLLESASRFDPKDVEPLLEELDRLKGKVK